MAQEYGLYEHIRFCSTVESSSWDDETKQWKTNVTVARGSKDAEATSSYTISSSYFVSAVGQLSQPSWPKIDGLAGFQGKTMHSAAWDWTYDLKGKKIAVVGSGISLNTPRSLPFPNADYLSTGCSAVQIVPELAKVASNVTVFQRTPHWILPRGDYEISPLRKTLYRWFPAWQRHWRRVYVDANETEFVSNNFVDHEENAKLKQAALDMMHEQLPNRPELWEKLTPQYPVGCKRVVVSDFIFPALARDNVRLEARPIHSVTDRTIQVSNPDGSVEDAVDELDLVVFATGFRANDFLHPMKIYGRNGVALHEVWKDGARAYHGTCADDMPNLGIILGPNTGLLHNSFILIIEAQSRYINGLIRPVLEARRQGHALSLTPKAERTEAYNDRLQRQLRGFAAADPRCNNWYKNASGLITNLWPGTVLEFQKQMEKVNYEDYESEGSGKTVVEKKTLYKVGRVVEEGGLLEKVTLAHIVALGTSAVVGGLMVGSFWCRIRQFLP